MLHVKPANKQKKCGLTKYAIHNSQASDKMTPFVLKILISKIYDA